MITLTVTDYEPKVAAQIANAYMEELNRLAVDLNTSSAHRERQFLEERLATAKAGPGPRIGFPEPVHQQKLHGRSPE